MTTSPGSARRVAMALMLLLVLTFCASPLRAQQPAPIIDPDASAVSEQSLLKEESRITGRIDIPNQTASVLMQASRPGLALLP